MTDKSQKGRWTKAALEAKATEKSEYWERLRKLRDWAQENLSL